MSSFEENEEYFACLRCGADMKYDWMACPKCGWRADDPGGDDEPVAEGQPGFLAGPWVRWAAWLLILALGILILLGLF